MEKVVGALRDGSASDASKQEWLQGLVEPGLVNRADCTRVAAAALEDTSPEVRRTGAEVLATVVLFAIDCIIERLQHSDEETKEATLDVLCNLVSDHGNENVVVALVSCLGDAEDSVKAKAATMLEALAGRGDDQVIECMIRVLESGRNAEIGEIILMRVLSALSKLVTNRSERLITLAAMSLEHQHPHVRHWAVECLEAVSQPGDRHAIAEVVKRFAHEHDYVRLAADLVLRRIAGEHVQFAMDALAELFQHEDSGVRAAAKITYGCLLRGAPHGL